MTETLPINVTKPEEIIGREFYLAVTGDCAKERISGLSKQVSPIKKFRRGLRELIAQFKGDKTCRFEDCDGSMIEVTSRVPYQLEGHLWPVVDIITYENGN